MTVARTLLLGAILVSLTAAPAVAQAGQEKPKGKPEAAQAARGKADDVGGSAELRIAREYFTRSGAKLKPLPPGIAKNLTRGKPLPPGIAKTRMPDELLGRLPKVPGREWALVGEVLLQLDGAGVVVNILGSIF
jgi:hypothetical protein